MQGAEPPVLQLAQEVPRTDAGRDVELPLAVDAEDVLKHAGGSVKKELTVSQRVGVANGNNLI